MINNKQNKRTRNQISGIKNKGSNTISFLNIPFNKLTIINNVNKTQNEHPKKISLNNIIKRNLHFHNSNHKTKGIISINDLIESKNCHLVAIFKDYLISDYIDEFLRRFYHKKEIWERIPKFEGYYKNYLTFFCKPIFSDFYANEIIQGYGEAKAEIYYNQTYGKKKKKDKINKEIAKTILNTLIKIEIDGINDFSNEENNNESIKPSKENTILLTINESMNINNQNKISNESSINSILNCFNQNINELHKNDFKTISSSSMRKIKKLKNISLQNQNSKKGINTLTITSNKNKSPMNKFIPNTNIPSSARLYSNNQNKEEKNNNKNSKITQIETSTSQNNLSNRTKNKSKDFSNSKLHQMTSTMSNSNFSRNYLKIPISSKNIGMYLNHKIYLNSNSPISSQRNKIKNSSNNKNDNTINKTKKNHLKKNSENIDLNNIMKLTLQVYDYKTRNIKNINNTINNNTKHFHTLSSPTINNFNININNHICLNNNNINSKNNKKGSFKGKNNINSRNKEQGLYKMNTDLEHRNKNYSPNFQNFATNTINDFDSIMKNKFFISLNGGNNDILIKNKHSLNSNRLFQKSNLKIKNIYEKDKSPHIRFSTKGYFNKNLKNHFHDKNIGNNISPPKTQK